MISKKNFCIFIVGALFLSGCGNKTYSYMGCSWNIPNNMREHFTSNKYAKEYDLDIDEHWPDPEDYPELETLKLEPYKHIKFYKKGLLDLNHLLPKKRTKILKKYVVNTFDVTKFEITFGELPNYYTKDTYVITDGTYGIVLYGLSDQEATDFLKSCQ